MEMQTWLIYLLFAIIITSSPGPAILFIMSNASIHGFNKLVFIALGNIVGLLCLGIIAVSGLGAILQVSEYVFTIIKYIGAMYLIYLGIKLILQKNQKFNALNNKNQDTNITSTKLFFQAFAVAVSNPKAIVFLTALFPQFVNIQESLIPQFSALIATLMFFSFFFLMTYALMVHKAKYWLSKPSRISLVNKISGSIFIGFGALLATSSNK
ncbi:MAG TPA: LysE family translocator [Arcobacter sp.]|nr:LysE family translocator [Arcobacter sp.]HIP56273.1 LysE family translocator [Arcobacter sp.]